MNTPTIMLVLINFASILAVAVGFNIGSFSPIHVIPEGLEKLYESDNNTVLEITAGQEAEKGQFPYQVGLRIYQKSIVVSWCSGAVISHRAVLTAAHCVHDISREGIIAYFGVVEFDGYDEKPFQIKIDKSLVIIHKEFDAKKVINDIAIVKLPTHINISETIQQIDLPGRDDKIEDNLYLSGWGRYSEKTRANSPILRYTETKIYSLDDCKKIFGNFPTDNNICISGDEGKALCLPDPGGPLALFAKDGRKVLFGICSYGVKSDCNKNYPIVYTRVAGYLDWIQNNMGNTRKT